MAVYKIVSIEKTSGVCEHCGRSDLQNVVTLEKIETGEYIRTGTTCAAKLRGITVVTQRKEEASFEKELVEKGKLQKIEFSKKINELIKNDPDVYKAEQKLIDESKKYEFSEISSIRGKSVSGKFIDLVGEYRTALNEFVLKNNLNKIDLQNVVLPFHKIPGNVLTAISEEHGLNFKNLTTI